MLRRAEKLVGRDFETASVLLPAVFEQVAPLNHSVLRPQHHKHWNAQSLSHARKHRRELDLVFESAESVMDVMQSTKTQLPVGSVGTVSEVEILPLRLVRRDQMGCSLPRVGDQISENLVTLLFVDFNKLADPVKQEGSHSSVSAPHPQWTRSPMPAMSMIPPTHSGYFLAISKLRMPPKLCPASTNFLNPRLSIIMTTAVARLWKLTRARSFCSECSSPQRKGPR